MGALPRPREPYAALTEAPQRAVRPGGADGALPRPQEPYTPYHAPVSPAPIASAPDALTAAPLDLPEMPKLARRGDWRQAAANIEDAVNYHLMGRASTN